MKANGFTLVEMLIAAVLLLVLLGALGALFLSTNRAYETNQNVTAASGQLRSAIEAIQRDVGQAGFTGRDIDSLQGAVPLSAQVGVESCLPLDDICPHVLSELTVSYVSDADTGGLVTVNYFVQNGLLMRQINEADAQPLATGIEGLDLVGYLLADGSIARAHLSAPSDYDGVRIRVRYLQGNDVRTETFTAAAQ